MNLNLNLDLKELKSLATVNLIDEGAQTLDTDEGDASRGEMAVVA